MPDLVRESAQKDFQVTGIATIEVPANHLQIDPLLLIHYQIPEVYMPDSA